jgi:hypothetical protein
MKTKENIQTLVTCYDHISGVHALDTRIVIDGNLVDQINLALETYVTLQQIYQFRACVCLNRHRDASWWGSVKKCSSIQEVLDFFR